MTFGPDGLQLEFDKAFKGFLFLSLLALLYKTYHLKPSPTIFSNNNAILVIKTQM